MVHRVHSNQQYNIYYNTRTKCIFVRTVTHVIKLSLGTFVYHYVYQYKQEHVYSTNTNKTRILHVYTHLCMLAPVQQKCAFTTPPIINCRPSMRLMLPFGFVLVGSRLLHLVSWVIFWCYNCCRPCYLSPSSCPALWYNTVSTCEG